MGIKTTRRIPGAKKKTALDSLRANWLRFLPWHQEHWDKTSMVLPMPHNKANVVSGASHWRSQKRLKDAYFGYLDYMLNQGLIPPPPETPPARATISATMYLTKRMDTGNAMNRFKYVEDWLVRNGYLQDDTEACLKWLTFPEQITGSKTPPRLVIELKALE